MDHSWTVAVADTLARAIELVGIVVMILGGLAACALFAVRAARRRPPVAGFEASYHELRANLGRAILLGLEFLVAADIIGTVAVAPSFRNLGILAIIVAVRTFLSFSLELEINGRWPWQQAGGRASGSRPVGAGPAT
ncbi:MAG TPA: DUF1622 domain-containing protein [Gemmatimonadaceae bacterium]